MIKNIKFHVIWFPPDVNACMPLTPRVNICINENDCYADIANYVSVTEKIKDPGKAGRLYLGLYLHLHTETPVNSVSALHESRNLKQARPDGGQYVDLLHTWGACYSLTGNSPDRSIHFMNMNCKRKIIIVKVLISQTEKLVRDQDRECTGSIFCWTNCGFCLLTFYSNVAMMYRTSVNSGSSGFGRGRQRTHGMRFQ